MIISKQLSDVSSVAKFCEVNGQDASLDAAGKAKMRHSLKGQFAGQGIRGQLTANSYCREFIITALSEQLAGAARLVR